MKVILLKHKLKWHLCFHLSVCFMWTILTYILKSVLGGYRLVPLIKQALCHWLQEQVCLACHWQHMSELSMKEIGTRQGGIWLWISGSVGWFPLCISKRNLRRESGEEAMWSLFSPPELRLGCGTEVPFFLSWNVSHSMGGKRTFN